MFSPSFLFLVFHTSKCPFIQFSVLGGKCMIESFTPIYSSNSITCTIPIGFVLQCLISSEAGIYSNTCKIFVYKVYGASFTPIQSFTSLMIVLHTIRDSPYEYSVGSIYSHLPVATFPDVSRRCAKHTQICKAHSNMQYTESFWSPSQQFSSPSHQLCCSFALEK